MAIIPVVLRLSGVAQNYDLRFVLATQGVRWSIGHGGPDHLGISYNALALDNRSTSCIQRIEYTGSTLTIRTGPGGGSDFELTAFIDAPDDAQWLGGYCVINDKARVSARLGDLAPVDWRGDINCAIPVMLPDIHRVTFTVQGIRPGQGIRIDLANDDDGHSQARWCVAPPENSEIGLVLRSSRDDVQLPIGRLVLDARSIRLDVAGTNGVQSASASLIMEVYVEQIRQCRYCASSSYVRMKVECDEPVVTTVQIGNHRPQYLAETYKLLAL